jgi:hypothetical protein
MPRIPYVVPNDEIKVRGGSKHYLRLYFGRQMRLQEIAKSVTQLIRDERIELSYYRAYEVRNYTERVSLQSFIFSFLNLYQLITNKY